MIEGILYQKNSTANNKAVLFIEETQYKVKVDNTTLLEGELSAIKISDRIGNIQRKITFSTGEVFSTNQNDLVDNLILKKLNKKNILHKFESNILLVFIAIIGTVLFAYATLKWGVPYTSKVVANSLPFEANKAISKGTLEFLDEYMLTKTKISKQKQKEIIYSFNTRLLPLIDDENKNEYKILFRNWELNKHKIANALALPDGHIILTDEFIKLSKNQDEIDSVVLHEIGHVYHRHGAQRLTQGAFMALVSMYLTGDLSSFAQMGVGLGSVLLSSNYSRNHESEADLYSFEKMIEANIDPINFANIMKKLSKDETTDKKSKDYLSSHPQTINRINQAKYYSDCFNKKDDCKNIEIK